MIRNNWRNLPPSWWLLARLTNARTSRSRVGLRIVVGFSDAGEQGVEHLVEQGGKDGVLAGKVAVDGRPARAGDVSDLVDADAVEAAFEEQLLRGSEDLFVTSHASSLRRCVTELLLLGGEDGPGLGGGHLSKVHQCPCGVHPNANGNST